jgi:hypothetical protein
MGRIKITRHCPMCKVKDPESITWSFEEGEIVSLCGPCLHQRVEEYKKQDEEDGEELSTQEQYEEWASEEMGENGYILEESITYL